MYKYSLIKYAKSWSTWIIAALTIAIVVIIAGYLPSHFLSRSSADRQAYTRHALLIVSSTTSFIAIFTSVFSGFKSATMYRDEIEDGSLLVMLSKPLTRNVILFAKWLALQTTIALYTFATSLTFLITIDVFDISKNVNSSMISSTTLTSKAIPISLLMWLVLEVLAIIFSSIGLLVSSKFSIGVSAGICIGIGVVIPATSIIGTFASKADYEDVSVANPEPKRLLDTGVLPKYTLDHMPNEAKELAAHLPDLKQGTIFRVGVKTGETDYFKWMQTLDINYQIQKLSEFASEQAIDPNTRDTLRIHGTGLYKAAGLSKVKSPLSTSRDKQVAALNQMIFNSWDKLYNYRVILATEFLDFIKNNDWPIDVKMPTYLAQYLEISTLNNNTKSKFDIKPLYPWIFHRQPITPEVEAKYSPKELTFWKTLFATNKEATDAYNDDYLFAYDYYAINNGICDLFFTFGNATEDLKINKDYPRLGKSGTLMSKAFDLSWRVFRPVDFWIDGFAFRNFRLKTGYAFDTTSSRLFGPDSDIAGTGFLSELIADSKWDAVSYFEAVSAIKAGHDVVLVRHVEYSNKYIILIIYLAIGLILLPATHLVIRKQDFR